MSKRVVGIFTTGEGHKSIAEAIKDGLGSEYKSEIFFDEEPLAKIYLPFYQYFPKLFKVPFKLSSSPECNIKKDQWIVNKTVINWDDDCNELIIYSIDNRHKNFYLFNNPKINYDILPINFQNYEQIHKYLDGNLVNNKYLVSKKFFIIFYN